MNKNRKLFNFEKEFLKKVIKDEEKNGSFKKTLFHVHTPESFDYDIFEHKSNEISNEERLIREIRKTQLLHESFQTVFFTVKEIGDLYKNNEDFLVYLLIAAKLYKAKFEVVLITDHNTISGYNKLKHALDYIHNLHKSFAYCDLLLGIELSCADKNHVIGIFRNDQNTINYIKNKLGEIIMNKEDGTYLSSIEIITKINELGGIAYIAHINTSSIFKNDYLTKAYKKKLFNNENLDALGVKKVEDIEKIKNQIKNLGYVNKEFCFFIDDDSHNIDKLGTSFFWIKGKTKNFDMIRNAIQDYLISVEVEVPKEPEIIIRGLMAVPWGDEGFFCESKENFKKPMIVTFSSSLSCLIGGRGTGKSTILKLLNFVLTQKCLNEEELKFICKNKYIFILVKLENKQYLIKFASPKIEGYINFLAYFSDVNEPFYCDKKLPFDAISIAHNIRKKYLKVHEIVKNGANYELITTNKTGILGKILDQQYSINELVEISKTNEINGYISEKLFQNKVIAKASKYYNRVNSISQLKSKLVKYEKDIEDRKDQVNTILNEFNKKQKGLLRITYCVNITHSLDYSAVKKIFNIEKKGEFFKGYNIKGDQVIEYILFLLVGVSFNEFLLTIINKEYELYKLNDLMDFCHDNAINTNIRIDNEKTKIRFFNDLFSFINEAKFLNEVKNYYSNFIKNNEVFDLEFNLNSNESDKGKPEFFKSIKLLSLGQKVVALFDFIIGYSEFYNDLRPLLLDQPEDNLDNRYIYINLVKQLREIKSNRQVIIATHNSTIVTNAKAETIIVLESNNNNAWVKKSGYPYEYNMIRHIVDNLEGGYDSFKHKLFIYNSTIK